MVFFFEHVKWIIPTIPLNLQENHLIVIVEGMPRTFDHLITVHMAKLALFKFLTGNERALCQNIMESEKKSYLMFIQHLGG